MPVRILGIGNAGYVGGYLTDLLLRSNHDVVVYDNLMYETRFLKNVKFIYGDIRDREKLSKILSQFDVLVILAAVVGDGACAQDPFLAQAINEDAVKWIVDNYSGKILFFSTCSVFGKNNNILTEDSPTNPLSVYAVTKIRAEQYIMKNHKDYLIFRLGTLFGLGDEHSRVRFDLVVNVLTKRAALGETLCVYGGEQWRPLLHVKDVAGAILFGLENNITGLYNLCYSNWQIKDIAEKIATIVPRARIEYQDMLFEDERNYRVDSSKYEKLGWRPKYRIEDGIQEIYNVIKEGRIKNPNDKIYSNEQYLA